jgi:hypothetical protein
MFENKSVISRKVISSCFRHVIYILFARFTKRYTAYRRSQWSATLSEAWTVFARSDTGIVGSNPTQGMDFSMHLFCVCV